MDEYNTGMDPEIKRYFTKIMRSFSWGAVWLISIATIGLFFQLGIVTDTVRWYNILFYFILAISLLLLIRYYYKVWK